MFEWDVTGLEGAPRGSALVRIAEDSFERIVDYDADSHGVLGHDEQKRGDQEAQKLIFDALLRVTWALSPLEWNWMSATRSTVACCMRCPPT